MGEQSYSYPDKLGFNETFMFHIRVMSSELATDGLDNEFEDLVDMAGWLLRPYLEEAEKWSKWTEVAEHKVDLLKADDPVAWGKAKRYRCEEKMGLVMNMAKDQGLLMKRVEKFKPDMDYYNQLEEGKGDEKDTTKTGLED